MTSNNSATGMWIVLGVTGALGLGVVLFALTGGGRDRGGEAAADETALMAPAATAEFGQRLIRETTRYMGPDQPDPAKRLTGNGLDCASCHLESGTVPGTLTLLAASSRYPRFSGRDGGERDLRDRINGCMQRSMNGHPLDRDSIEMIAMEKYIVGLGQQFSLMSEAKTVSDEPALFEEPARRADTEAGRLVYESKCRVCHGYNGEGLKESSDALDGYLFPPLWGPASYNNGAGMNRVLTAARFIKARMPLGAPDLSDDEAYDVSAYINSQPRPEKANLAEDYPELFRKPVDSPYPPYADPFPQEQHKYGPYDPIRDFYADREG